MERNIGWDDRNLDLNYCDSVVNMRREYFFLFDFLFDETEIFMFVEVEERPFLSVLLQQDWFGPNSAYVNDEKGVVRGLTFSEVNFFSI